MMDHSNQQLYWDQRWQQQQTGWDIGYASPAITQYMDRYPRREAAILIPGCGNAHEAKYLLDKGFNNITLLDIAPVLVDKLQKQFQDNTGIRVICDDFFLHNGQYDLIIEQTFFCAIPPGRRNDYATRAAFLLHDSGSIIGVMFDTQFERQGPPFGGSTTEYKATFDPFFEIKKMEACYNSIAPRAGTEIFIRLSKKS